MKTIVRNALLALTCAFQVVTGCANAAAAPAADPMPDTVVSGKCSWDHPGVDPYMGDVVGAVDRYRDIPADVRERLKARMENHEYDDLVSIRRDSIEGRGGYDYGNTITDMHFGTHQLCRSVTRASWSPQMQERGLVYCDGGYCILVPTICRNVSRVTRTGVGPAVAGLPPLLAGGPADEVPGFPPIDWFGPAGAGMPAPVEAPLDVPGGGSPPLEGTVGGYPFAGIGAGPLLGAAFTGGVIGAASGGVIGAPNGGGSMAGGAQNVALPGGPLGAIGSTIALVPEPSSWALLLLGAAVLAARARRRAIRP